MEEYQSGCANKYVHFVSYSYNVNPFSSFLSPPTLLSTQHNRFWFWIPRKMHQKCISLLKLVYCKLKNYILYLFSYTIKIKTQIYLCLATRTLHYLLCFVHLFLNANSKWIYKNFEKLFWCEYKTKKKKTICEIWFLNATFNGWWLNITIQIQ